MRKQESSLWERLIICCSVLTKKNYIYLGLSKKPFVLDDNGAYLELKKGEFSSYSCVGYDYEFQTKDGKTNLHDFAWNHMKLLARLAEKGEI